MRYIRFLLIFLRIHGLLPPEEVINAGILDTLRIICIALPPWVVLLTSIAYAYVNFRRTTLADITDVMCTNFICLIVIINNIVLAIKKFEIRAIVVEMRKMVEKRNLFSFSTFFALPHPFCYLSRTLFVSLDHLYFSKALGFNLTWPTINIVTKYHLF